MAKTFEDIYKYDDFKHFLDMFFIAQKKKSGLSIRNFAQRAGFGSHSSIIHYISGKRQVTKNSLLKLIKGLGLTGKEAKYFKTLVQYNQSVSKDERELLATTLKALREKSNFFEMHQLQLRYFKKWYNPVIRELVVYSNWKDDYKKLASMIIPPISEEEAKDSVTLLLNLDLIRSDGEKYCLTNTVLLPGNIPSFIYKDARNDMMERAKDASHFFSSKERYILNYTYSISEESEAKIREVLQNLEDELEAIMISDKEESYSKVAQLNIQNFPLTKKYRG